MKIVALLFYTSIIFISCLNENSGTEKENTGDTPNSGAISFGVDESLFPLLNEEKEIFENENPKAVIELKIVPESFCIDSFLEKKFRAIISTRKLTEEETAIAKQNDLNPLHYLIAFDGLAFIVNKKNADSVLSASQIDDILKSQWEGDIEVVFDNNGAGEIDFIKNKYGLGTKLPGNYFATNGFTELINYVSTHTNAFGVIGANKLIYESDSVSGKNFQIVAVLDTGEKKYLPTELNIRNGQYPFRREVYILCGEGWSGLGTGFAKFVTTDIGQTIIKRAGLTPARQAMRMIEIKKSYN